MTIERVNVRKDVYCMTVPKTHNFVLKTKGKKGVVVKNCGIMPYCCGHNIRDLLEQGLGGVKFKVNSGPANHLNSAMQQVVNFLGCFGKSVKFVLADGSTKSFSEAEREGLTSADVLSFDPETGYFVAKQATSIGLRGRQELVTFEMEDGTLVGPVTPWHEFWTKNRGWVKAEDLTEEDDVEV
jgi:hypothetical protein